jgi:hypothetical protein
MTKSASEIFALSTAAKDLLGKAKALLPVDASDDQPAKQLPDGPEETPPQLTNK